MVTIKKSVKVAYSRFFFSFQTSSPINNQGFLRSLRVIIYVLWQTQAAANWQDSMREMLCKFYEWQRRLAAWLSTCNFDLLGGRWTGGKRGATQGPSSVSFSCHVRIQHFETNRVRNRGSTINRNIIKSHWHRYPNSMELQFLHKSKMRDKIAL